jgi:probable rRNA maturation factor
MRSRRTKRDKVRRTARKTVWPTVREAGKRGGDENKKESRAGDGQAIINRQRGVRLAIAPLETFLQHLCAGLGLAGTELVICFVTDAEIARMNLAFRKKRGPTDVLSFPAEKQKTPRRTSRRLGAGGSVAGDGGEVLKGVAAKTATGKYLGDIAISPVTAQRNAAKYGRELPTELRILMLHGVLHLLGYDHEVDGGEMERLEARLRRRFGLA